MRYSLRHRCERAAAELAGASDTGPESPPTRHAEDAAARQGTPRVKPSGRPRTLRGPLDRGCVRVLATRPAAATVDLSARCWAPHGDRSGSVAAGRRPSAD